ncbi:MAG: hypothetical protein CSA50_06630 [Gammaproteobacteria bacterium]|nr:MAG: hypothetical protein CSA50_06630 [Gammaproteobacteria bacterium]
MTEQERRRYFRIEDKVLMSYRVVGEETEQAGQPGSVAEDSAVGTRQALNALEEKVQQKMVRLKGDEPLIAELLELFNQKINLLIADDREAIQGSAGDSKQTLAVNMSACGIAFPSEEKLAIGTLLVLDITLTLSFVSLCLTGQVVGVEKPGGGHPYIIRVDFVDISEVDRELLVQNVIRRQSEQLKALREAREKA